MIDRMDKKNKTSDDSYPNLVFYIDNYEQVLPNVILCSLCCCHTLLKLYLLFPQIFNQVALYCPGEKVAVQISAVNPVRAIHSTRIVRNYPSFTCSVCVSGHVN